MTAALPTTLDQLQCDPFEVGLLTVARHFLTAFDKPDAHAWQNAYTVAAERWGETIGFPAAHTMGKLVRALLRTRSEGFAFYDPLVPETKSLLSPDETDLVTMLHNMRRDNTDKARAAVEALTHGRMDPDVIRTGLSLAARFGAGAPLSSPTPKRPALTVVS